MSNPETMLPVGGPRIWPRIWGNATWARDDTPDMIKANVTYGWGGPPTKPKPYD